GPDRVRGQGRLARDGHLRHHQHADERLRLPHLAHGGQGVVDGPARQAGVRHLARADGVPPAGVAGPHMAGGRAVAGAEEERHVPAGHVRRPAVPRGGTGRPGLLHLPRDQSRLRHRLDRRPHRRLHGLRQGQERRGRQGPDQALRPGVVAGHRHRPGPRHARGQLQGRHQRLQRAAEARRRAGLAGQAHRPVPRPRHAAGLRLHGDDPVAAVVHRQTRRDRFPRKEHRAAEGQHLPLMAVKTRRYSARDVTVLVIGLGVAVIVNVGLCWGLALASLARSATDWNGLGPIEWSGGRNYGDLAGEYPPFWSAVRNNVLWLVFLGLVATPFGLFCAVLLDRRLRGSRLYQSALYMPVVLSLAVVGFIAQLVYSHDYGVLNAVTGLSVDWLGDRSVNIWVVMVAAAWRHVGYVMIIYLAGLKAVDPALKEAAAIDGANEWQTFFRVVFPTLRPVNVIVLVIT